MRPIFFFTLGRLLCACFLVGSHTSLHAHTLESVIEDALSVSPQVKYEEAVLESLKWSTWSDRHFFLPSITGTATRTITQPSLTYDSLALTASMTLFDFGSSFLKKSSAVASLSSQEVLIHHKRLSTEYAAATAYFDLLAAHHTLLILEEGVAWNRENLAIARARFQKGLTPEEEVLKLQIDHENDTTRLDRARADYSNIKVKLEEILQKPLNLPPTKGLQTALPWPLETQLADIPKIVKRLESKELKTLNEPNFSDTDIPPSIKAKELSLKASELTETASLMNLFPTLSGQFAYGIYQTPGQTLSPQPQWTLSLQLSIPFFDRWTTYSAYRSRVESRKALEFDFETARRSQRESLSTTLTQLQTTLRTYLNRKPLHDLSKKLYRTAIRRFQNGRSNANEFTIDQSRFFNSELVFIDTLKSVHKELLAYCHTRGKAFLNCDVSAL